MFTSFTENFSINEGVSVCGFSNQKQTNKNDMMCFIVLLLSARRTKYDPKEFERIIIITFSYISKDVYLLIYLRKFLERYKRS